MNDVLRRRCRALVLAPRLLAVHIHHAIRTVRRDHEPRTLSAHRWRLSVEIQRFVIRRITAFTVRPRREPAVNGRPHQVKPGQRIALQGVVDPIQFAPRPDAELGLEKPVEMSARLRVAGIDHARQSPKLHSQTAHLNPHLRQRRARVRRADRHHPPESSPGQIAPISKSRDLAANNPQPGIFRAQHPQQHAALAVAHRIVAGPRPIAQHRCLFDLRAQFPVERAHQFLQGIGRIEVLRQPVAHRQEKIPAIRKGGCICRTPLLCPDVVAMHQRQRRLAHSEAKDRHSLRESQLANLQIGHHGRMAEKKSRVEFFGVHRTEHRIGRWLGRRQSGGRL